MRSIPIGVVPLGRENRFYQSHHSTTAFKSPVRYNNTRFCCLLCAGCVGCVSCRTRVIGDATMDIIRGEHTQPLNLMEIKASIYTVNLYVLCSMFFTQSSM